MNTLQTNTISNCHRYRWQEGVKRVPGSEKTLPKLKVTLIIKPYVMEQRHMEQSHRELWRA